MSNFEPTLLENYVIEVKILSFSTFQDIYREFIYKNIRTCMKEDENYDTLILLHFYPKINSNFGIIRSYMRVSLKRPKGVEFLVSKISKLSTFFAL